jgi:hypothetical protein
VVLVYFGKFLQQATKIFIVIIEGENTYIAWQGFCQLRARVVFPLADSPQIAIMADLMNYFRVDFIKP